MKQIKIQILTFLILTMTLESNEIYNFKLKDIKGTEIEFSKYKGSPTLIVNVASKCGYTYQYENLEKLFKSYKNRGLKIVGFPANDFGSQEPGTNEEIAQFCKLKYDVSFDMMSKITVKGKDKHPFYKFLLENSPTKGEISWNFEKFLVDKNGKIVGRFSSSVEPDSKEIIKLLETLF